MRAPDGRLIYIGRRDFQVKIRGFRVDVAEIENALSAMPGIKRSGGRRQGDRDPASSDCSPISFRRRCRRSPPEKSAHICAHVFPDYMVPSVFIAMDAIPRTPNGKTDRLGLPPPGRDRPDGDGPLKVPGTPIEIELAAIWADVLGIDRIGTDETFVELGGDSLKAATIAARVAARFELDISAARLLDAGTVGDMAAEIADAAGDPIAAAPSAGARLTRKPAQIAAPQFQQRSKFAGESSLHAAQWRVPAGRGIGLHRSQQRLRTLAVGLALEPHLRLRDVGRDLADDARRVLVEHVRADAGLLQPVGEQVRVVALAGDVEAEHAVSSVATGGARRPVAKAPRRAAPLAAHPMGTADSRPCSTPARSRAAARGRRAPDRRNGASRSRP